MPTFRQSIGIGIPRFARNDQPACFPFSRLTSHSRFFFPVNPPQLAPIFCRRPADASSTSALE